jgi:dephospho-CoA kinase
VPLLYETGAEKDFGRVIVTTCSLQTQLARLRERGMSEDAARQRLAAQWPTERKASRADFVVNTDGTFEETDAQVEAIFRSLQNI